MITDFQDKPEECTVFVADYLIGCSGLNLHPLCRVGIHLESAVNLMTLRQAKAPIRRIKQHRCQLSIVITLDGSWNDALIHNMISKAIPDAVAQISPEDIKEDGDTGVVWVAPEGSTPQNILEFIRKAEAKINGVFERMDPAEWTRVHRGSNA